MKKTIIILVCIALSCNIVQAQWSQIGQDIDGPAEGDLAGWSVSLNSDGSIVALSDLSNDANGVNSGQVRVFENNNNTWVQIGQAIQGEATDNSYGYSVSLNASGSIVAIGSPYDDVAGANSGLVQVFENVNGSWIQIGQDLNGGDSFDEAGWSVSLNAEGNILAIGSDFYGEDGSQVGQVRIFENIKGSWSQIGQDINGEDSGENSGWTVSLNNDGTIVAIGAPRNGEVGSQAGHARIYENINGTWIQLGQDIDAEAEFDLFGFSVSLNSDGSMVAIGGIHNEGNGSLSGHVRVLEYNNGDWVQIGADIDGEEGETFGLSVSLSDDGSKLGVVAATPGIARMYENNNGSWEQIGENIDEESIGTYFARSISVNSDASFVAVGSPFNTGGNTGHVKVFGDVTLGTSEDLKEKIAIYPNPTNGILNIKGNNAISQVLIYDVLGKIMCNNQLSTNNNLFQIDMSKFENGMYIIKVQEDNSVYETKIMKY
jgi:hypothetical protein